MKIDNALAKTEAPTVEQEMAKFGGFSTNNGETVDPKTTTKGPGDRNLSEDEEKAGLKVVGEVPRKAGEAKGGEAKPAKVELTDAEKTAAVDKARTALKLADDEELTDEEEAEALETALTEKKAANKPGATRDDRVKRAQEGRRRAEARAARAERELGTLAQRIAALESGGGKAPLTGAAEGAKDDAKDQEPDPSKFDLGELDPKYIRALARWETRQELAEASKNQQSRQTDSQKERAAAEFAEKKAAFEDAGLEAYDDFQEVVIDTVGLPKSDAAFWPLSATMGTLMIQSEQGAHIAYVLASDPKEAKRIAKLPDAEQQRWFFKQEAKFESEQTGSGEEGAGEDGEQSGTQRRQAKTEAAPRQISKAPAPIPRNRGGNRNSGVTASTTDFAAFEAMANGNGRAAR